MLKMVLEGRLLSRRRKVRPRTRWLDNVVMGVRGLGGRLEDRAGWSRGVKVTKGHQGLYCCCC